MKTRRIALCLIALLLLSGTVLLAQGAEEQFAREAQILDEDLEKVFDDLVLRLTNPAGARTRPLVPLQSKDGDVYWILTRSR